MTVTVFDAVAPFAIRGRAPVFHASTDAVCGSESWTPGDRWKSPDDAARAAEAMEQGGDAEFHVADDHGRRVIWPVLGPELPPGWWTSIAYKRSLGLGDDDVLF